ncbi:hypothetical protein [Nocardia sp. NPDC051981]|uniref:hypothetical protein n=1 Tax=Nocardia sp. NPDC051981 TaxID=3155417 RepID=UPI0034165D06
MNGKMLDFVLIAVVAVVFLAYAIFAPGLGTAVVAWLGLTGLGYYNSFVRHDPALVDRVGGGARPVDHSTTLRSAWR